MLLIFITIAYMVLGEEKEGEEEEKQEKEKRRGKTGRQEEEGEEPPSKFTFQMNNQTFHSKVEMERYRREGFFYFKLNILILSGKEMLDSCFWNSPI